MNRIILQLAVLLFLSISMSAQTPVASYDFTIDTVDVSGNGNDLSYDSAPFSAAVSEDCRQYLKVVDNGFLRKDMPTLNITTEFTVAFWMRTDSLTADQKIIGQAAPGIRGFVIGPDNGKIKAEVFGSDDYTLKSNYSLIAGEWTHIAVRYKSENALTIYINGAFDKVLNLIGTDPWTPGLDAADDLIVGGAPWFPSELSYTGDLDDLVIYNQELFASDITDIYNNLATCPATGAPIYVDNLATGGNSSLSWDDAYTNLQDAIDKSCHCPDAPIWVADGTYRPTTAVDIDGNSMIEDREKTFHITDAIEIYGGFSGTEVALSDRVLNANPTILTGDLGNNQDTAYHVVYIDHDDTAKRWVLDGLIIRDGKADEPTSSDDNQWAAGLFADRVNGEFVIRNCSFENNFSAAGQGGGALISGSDVNVEIYNSSFRDNFARSEGGGLYFSPLGVGSLKLNNCVFSNNISGGFSGGGIDVSVDLVEIVNCTFYNNHAGSDGGGMSVDVTEKLNIKNSIFWGNTADVDGYDIAMNTSDPGSEISHSIISLGGLFIDDGSDIDTSTVYLHYDPILDNNLKPNMGSPAIDAGLNQAIMSKTDIDGKERLIGSRVDMGAYEYGDNENCDPTVYLHPNQIIDQTRTYRTNQLIYATNKIVSTDVIYNALLGVELGLQFEVAQGALFEAKLVGCE